MSRELSDSPWLFRRDEFNLLEEAFEDILRRHELSVGTAHYDMEELVIKEQMDTEDISEVELTLRFGSEWMEPMDTGFERPDQVDFDRPLREQLLHQQQRDPFYLRAVKWAESAHAWAKAQYETKKDQDLYRVQVNAFLVPIKVFFALSEQMQADRHAIDIALKEFELADTYLERAHDSLVRLERQNPSVTATKLAQEAAAILKELRAYQDQLKQQRRFRGDMLE